MAVVAPKAPPRSLTPVPQQAPRSQTGAAPKLTPVSGRKRQIAGSIRKLAAQVQGDHPEMGAHVHLRDAAATLDTGNTAGAVRHLQTAAHAFTPQSLYRHGIVTDDGHTAARRHMYSVTRHVLLIRDVQDTEARNQQKIARTNTETSTAQSGQVNAPLVTSNPSATAVRPSGPAAMNAPSGALPTGGRAGVAGAPATPPQAVSRQWAAANPAGGLELSAQTARLAVTPAPRGRPGGPGLYDVKGLGHTPYLQNIVKALIRKRGMPPDRAYAIARGAIRKWSRGGGHVHPEVRAAAGAAEAGEIRRQAQAKAAHGHVADSWAGVIELVGTAAGSQKDQRIPPGQPGGGRFGTANQGGKPQGKPAPGGPAAGRAARKAQLLSQAKADRQQAAALTKQLNQLLHSRASTARKTAKATAAATKAGQTGKTAASTPAKKTTPAKTSTKAKTGKKMTRAQQISSLRSQIARLLATANQLTAQAAKL